jgi:hypothetical protein
MYPNGDIQLSVRVNDDTRAHDIRVILHSDSGEYLGAVGVLHLPRYTHSRAVSAAIRHAEAFKDGFRGTSGLGPIPRHLWGVDAARENPVHVRKTSGTRKGRLVWRADGDHTGTWRAAEAGGMTFLVAPWLGGSWGAWVVLPEDLDRKVALLDDGSPHPNEHYGLRSLAFESPREAKLAAERYYVRHAATHSRGPRANPARVVSEQPFRDAYGIGKRYGLSTGMGSVSYRRYDQMKPSMIGPSVGGFVTRSPTGDFMNVEPPPAQAAEMYQALAAHGVDLHSRPRMNPTRGRVKKGAARSRAGKGKRGVAKRQSRRAGR